MYNNELLTLLKICPSGTSIGRHCTTCPAFADDVTLIAPTKQGMQKLMTIAQNYASKWRYEYNINKCSVIAFGKDLCPGIPLLLGAIPVEIKPSEEHVGTLLTDRSAEITKYIKKRIEQCKKRSCAITGIGSRNAPMLPKPASKLYWTVCVPKLTYGLHLMSLPAEASAALESYHAETAKTFQGLPDRASNDGAIFTMGWPTLSEHIDIIRLTFFMRILLLPIKSVYKRILIVRYIAYMKMDSKIKTGPFGIFLNLCKKLDIMKIVKPIIEECYSINLREWKHIVRERVWKNENSNWIIISGMSRTLGAIKMYEKRNVFNTWWNYVHKRPAEVAKCKNMLKIVLNCH